MALGREIIKTFESPQHGDMLSNWMAHYLAELMIGIGAARGKERRALQAECIDVILKIWKHRHSWRNGRRPLEPFEPAIQTLEELRSDAPRYYSLRNHPRPESLPKESGALLSAALAIDRAGSALIQYCLALSIAHIPKRDKRWLKFIERIEGKKSADARVVVEFVSSSEDLIAKKSHLDSALQERMKELLADLDKFAEWLDPMRKHLQRNLGELQSKA